MKRNHFKYLTFGAFLALTFTLTTGCSKNGDGGGDGTIRFWVYQPSKPEDQTAYKNLMTEFKEETGISVQLLMIVKDSYN